MSKIPQSGLRYQRPNTSKVVSSITYGLELPLYDIENREPLASYHTEGQDTVSSKPTKKVGIVKPAVQRSTVFNQIQQLSNQILIF